MALGDPLATAAGAATHACMLVDPAAAVGDASRILDAAWPAPALVYSPAYLAWQLGFPSALEPLAVLARDAAGQAVGFAAATPRPARLDDWREDVYIVSFVAVLPSHRGQGISTSLYRALLGAIDARGRAVVTFAQAESVGRRTLLSTYRAAGFDVRSLGPRRAFAAVIRPPAAGAPAGDVVDAAILTDVDEAAALVDRVPMPGTLALAGDAPTLAHYARDARGRALVHAAGTLAFALRAEMRTPSAIERPILLDGVLTSAATLDGVLACARGAAQALGDQAARVTTVTVPSLVVPGQPDAVPAGLRRVPTKFEGWFCIPPGRGDLARLAPADTTFEVV